MKPTHSNESWHLGCGVELVAEDADPYGPWSAREQPGPSADLHLQRLEVREGRGRGGGGAGRRRKSEANDCEFKQSFFPRDGRTVK